MKKIVRFISRAVIVAVISVTAIKCTGTNQPTQGGEGIVAVADPNAPEETCVVSKAEFEGWFSGGVVTKDGWVNPANSLSSLNDNCDFYQWSWQMFLWNLSTANGSVAFDNPPFYDLEGSNLVQNGKATKVRGGKVDAVGQAGVINGVLMSQDYGITPDGSLIYYAIHVNDVYAYFASGKNSGALDSIDQFPTTQGQLDAIVNYAKKTYGVDIEYPDALTMELKSSWVKVKDGAIADDYLTIEADIPLYKKESDTKWTWDGTTMERGVTLALVGYHLVGSVAGHPEMVWATFEHKDNVADANYYYTNVKGDLVESEGFDTTSHLPKKDWLFTSSAVKYNASNQMHMETGYDNPNNIDATGGNVISASSTARTHPWGNKPEKASAPNNTMLMSINQNIAGMLAEGDVRANYQLIGATWTKNGIPGVGNQLPVLAGSQVLSNSTMETYFQYKTCFSCHQGGKLDSLSHIFKYIKPLPIRQ